MLLLLLFISKKNVNWGLFFENLKSSKQFLTVEVFEFMVVLRLFWRLWTEVVFYIGGLILKTCPEVSCFVVANVKRTFSVPWGHSVFNGTQLTIYWTRYGRLTRAEILSFSSHSYETFCTNFFFQINVSLLYGFFMLRNHDATPTEKGEFSRCNLAVEANVTCLRRSRRTGAYLMVENIRFVAGRRAPAMCLLLLWKYVIFIILQV